MNSLFGLYKIIIGIVSFFTGIVSVFITSWFIFKDVSTTTLLASLILGIALTVFNTKFLYKKGMGILAAICFIVQVFLTLLANYLGELEDSVGFFEALMADNKTHVIEILPLLGIIILVYAAGFALKILSDRETQKAQEIRMQKQREEDELAKKLQAEREEAEREARREAYYKDMEDRQKAYERFQRDYQNSQNTTNNPDSEDKEYESAKNLFGIDSDDYTLEQIKARRNMLIKASHPDGAGGDMEFAQKVNKAFSILKARIS